MHPPQKQGTGRKSGSWLSSCHSNSVCMSRSTSAPPACGSGRERGKGGLTVVGLGGGWSAPPRVILLLTPRRGSSHAGHRGRAGWVGGDGSGDPLVLCFDACLHLQGLRAAAPDPSVSRANPPSPSSGELLARSPHNPSFLPSSLPGLPVSFVPRSRGCHGSSHAPPSSSSPATPASGSAPSPCKLELSI